MLRPRTAPPWRHHQPFRLLRLLRAQSTNPLPPPPSRLDRLTSKLPRRLQPYTQRLRRAPVSHVVSFLILHEITAAVPLLGLCAFFHYTDYVPVGYMTRHFGDYVDAGVLRFERYFRRKGWFGFGGQREEAEAEAEAEADINWGEAEEAAHREEAVRRRDGGERKYKILVEVALAYAVTKALLPVRIVASVWATPWFAGVLARLGASFTRK